MIFRLEVFQCGCLDLDHKNTLLLSPNEGTRTSRRQAPQAQAEKSWWIFPHQQASKCLKSQMENSGQRSRKLVRSLDSPFTIYGSLVQPNVLGNQEANDCRNPHVFLVLHVLHVEALIKYSSSWFYPEVGS